MTPNWTRKEVPVPRPHPFVTYLERLSEDRAALAALRRGLGQPLGTVADMYQYVVPWVPQGSTRRYEEALYLIAALYASHPESGGQGNVGDHFARVRQPGGHTAVERRFVALLSSHPDDLPLHLRQAVSYLKSRDVVVNWDQLLRDLLHWGYPDRRVQKQWARRFWSSAGQQGTTQEA